MLRTGDAGQLLRAVREGRLLRAPAGGTCGCAAGNAEPAPEIRETVRERYAAAARAAAAGQDSSCCVPVSTTDKAGEQVFGSVLYAESETEGATAAAVEASLGCGVPTAVADLHEGEIVLDLGSGAGATRSSAPAGSA